MIKTRKDLQVYLQEDGKRNNCPSLKSYLYGRIIGSENAAAYRFLRALRRCEYHFNNRSNLLHNVLYLFWHLRKNHLGLKYSIQIPLNKTGYGLRILHLAGGGIILNVNNIGNYCGFNAGVILGDNGQEAKPILGDYVAFGPGAKAFGDIVIEENVFVAANAVVTKNVPKNSIVAGVPAKIIKVKQENRLKEKYEKRI